MNPHLKYRSNNAFSWTRADMLLLIYERAVTALQDGVRCLESRTRREAARPEDADLNHARNAVQRAIVAISEGLNPDLGEVPTNIMRLCIFVIDQTRTDSLTGWQSSFRVIQTLREGFLAVADDARLMEHSGRIPGLDVTSN